MNWYVKNDGTLEISGPMSKEAALEIDGLLFSEAIFEPKIVTTPEVEKLLSEISLVKVHPDTPLSILPFFIEICSLLDRVSQMLILLSAKKIVTGSIEGGVLSLDEVSDGVVVDIRELYHQVE